MTTYGKRAEDVYYAIESIFRQTILPNRIILWLSETEFSKDNLPCNLRNLILLGLEIRFCKDLKSYMKLVPTLELYPEATIITIDDDVIYWEGTVETLLKRHLKNPNQIFFLSGSKIALDTNGAIRPYVTFWKQKLVPGISSPLNFPTGIGGVLYPPNSLNKEVLNKDAYMKICPTADDIWFKAMSLLNNTECIWIELSKPIMKLHTPLKENQETALNIENVKMGKNDQYLKQVFNNYQLINKLSNQ